MHYDKRTESSQVLFPQDSTRNQPIMADDPPTQQPPPTSTINTTAPSDNQFQLEAKVEDAETRAAREELKHTVISDKPTDPADDMQLRSGNAYNEAAETRAKTPDLRPPEADDTSKKPSSPGKKKRAHDEVEPNGKEDGNTSTTRTSSGADSDSWVVVDDAGTIGGDEKRQHRSEPQKKRARDETSPPADIHKGTGAVGVWSFACLLCFAYLALCTLLFGRIRLN